MFFRSFTLAATLVTSSVLASAQTTGIITGTAVDADTREPLIGVTVSTAATASNCRRAP